MANWTNAGRIVGPQGPAGDSGESLQYDWQDTQLGVKQNSDESYTYTDLQGPAGEQGPAGSDGKRGPEGPEGPRGPAGPAVKIKGTYDNQSQLPSNPEIGDAYIVGNDLYVYNG